MRDSAPGDDTIVYSMLKNAPRTFLHQLTHLYTRSLQDGRLPSCWKTATIVPIPKKNNTYRPISLLPVLGKVMEKIILQRIRWSAEPPNTRATGFKPGSGTRDAVVFRFTIYRVSKPEDGGEQSSIWTYRKHSSW